MTTLVTIMSGKGESVDRITVKTFLHKESAQEFVSFTNESYTPTKKHWTYAEIVFAGETIELARPEV